MGERIKVHCYSGSKGEEWPRSFIYQGKESFLVEVLQSSYCEDISSKERKRKFLVKTFDSRMAELSFLEREGIWILERIEY